MPISRCLSYQHSTNDVASPLYIAQILTVNRAKQIKEPVIRWSLDSMSMLKIKMNVADKTTLYVVLGLGVAFVIFLILSGVAML